MISTFCGDTYCDEGETCLADCGECPPNRTLERNIYTSPIPFGKAEQLKDDGYVIVRYFYSVGCNSYYIPVHIENALKSLANAFPDLFVLELIDTSEYPAHANTYAKVGGIVYKPLIRVEGIADGSHGYGRIYGGGMGIKVQDGDIQADVAALVCLHSDYCEFKGGKVVRTF